MRRSHQSAGSEPAFVSQQVTEARRHYLNLKPSRTAPFSVVCFGVERMRSEYRVARSDFPYLAVEVVLEGQGTLMLQGKSYPLSPGVVFAYGPKVPHLIRTDPRDRMRKFYLDFTGREGLLLLRSAGLASWQPVRVAAVHELMEVFEAMSREAREEGPMARPLCEALGRLLLLKIRQRAVPGGRSVPRSFATYERIRGHLEEHHLRLRTIDELARECHVNPMYVARLFRRFARSGAYQLLLRRKMNRAAEMLMEEGLMVKETAARLGFPDAFQFSRAFKRIHGVPPTEIQRSSSGKNDPTY